MPVDPQGPVPTYLLANRTETSYGQDSDPPQPRLRLLLNAPTTMIVMVAILRTGLMPPLPPTLTMIFPRCFCLVSLRIYINDKD